MFTKRIEVVLKTTSAKEMSKQLNISEAAISKWKNGKAEPKLNHIKAICETYDIDANWLLGIGNNKDICADDKIQKCTSEQTVVTKKSKKVYKVKIKRIKQ